MANKGVKKPVGKPSNRPDYIPAALFVKVISPFIVPDHERFKQESNGKGAERSEFSPLSRLAQDAGISQRTLWGYLNGEKEWILFDNADKILCALGKPYLWWWSDLAGTYWNIPLDYKRPLDAPKKKKTVPRGTCAGPGCHRRFNLRKGGSKKKYCSASCRGKAHRLRYAA